MLIAAPENNLLARQSILLRHPDRLHILRPYQRNHAVNAQSCKRVLHARRCGFRGVAIAPEIAPHMIADLNVVPSIHVPQETATVANQFVRVAQQHRPQAKTLAPIAVAISLDPFLDALAIEGRRIILHRYRIAQDSRQRVYILRHKPAQAETAGLQHYTLLHSSARGSSLCSSCKSCHSSRAFRSCAAGTMILTSTISSPRAPSCRAEGTPFSRRRSFCPLCVPGGIFNCDRPSIVGTSIFAPNADSQAATGTVT